MITGHDLAAHYLDKADEALRQAEKCVPDDTETRVLIGSALTCVNTAQGMLS